MKTQDKTENENAVFNAKTSIPTDAQSTNLLNKTPMKTLFKILPNLDFSSIEMPNQPISIILQAFNLEYWPSELDQYISENENGNYDITLPNNKKILLKAFNMHQELIQDEIQGYQKLGGFGDDTYYDYMPDAIYIQQRIAFALAKLHNENYQKLLENLDNSLANFCRVTEQEPIECYDSIAEQELYFI